MIPRRDTLAVEQVVPNNAASKSLNVGNGWAWGTWTEISAGLSFPFILTHIAVSTLWSGTGTGSVLANDIQIQVGTGSAGNESSIGECGDSFYASVANGASFNLATNKMYSLAPVLIPANTRLAGRVTQLQSSTLTIDTLLLGYDATKYSIARYMQTMRDIDNFLKGLKTKTSKVVPSAGNTLVSAGIPAWTWGSWVDFLSPASKDCLIQGVISYKQGIGKAVHQGIGVGASAGGETMMSVTCTPGALSACSCGISFLPRPLFIKKGEYVGIRQKSNLGGFSAYLNLFYQELT